MHAAPKQVSCPVCKKRTAFDSSNAYRPFCSERCNTIDLGDWANENYRIPDTTPTEPDDEAH